MVCLWHLSLLIFQQIEHFSPSAFLVSALISLSFVFIMFTSDVMHNSAKSIFSINLDCSLFIFIVKFASRLEPISLLALFSSILILQISLIFFNSIHFSFNFIFSNSFGNLKACRAILLINFHICPCELANNEHVKNPFISTP